MTIFQQALSHINRANEARRPLQQHEHTFCREAASDLLAEGEGFLACWITERMRDNETRFPRAWPIKEHTP